MNLLIIKKVLEWDSRKHLSERLLNLTDWLLLKLAKKNLSCPRNLHVKMTVFLFRKLNLVFFLSILPMAHAQAVMVWAQNILWEMNLVIYVMAHDYVLRH